MLDHLGIRHYELAQYEADDIIGTLGRLAEKDSFDVTIVSGDKDLIQLTDEHTVVEISKKGVAEFEAFTPDYLMEKMGLTPAQFIDLKALMGISLIISLVSRKSVKRRVSSSCWSMVRSRVFMKISMG